MHCQYGCSTMVFCMCITLFFICFLSFSSYVTYLLLSMVNLPFPCAVSKFTGISHNDQVDASTILPFVQVSLRDSSVFP